MRKCLVRDAATAATAARIYDILRECDVILSEHGMRAEQGHYGDNYWVVALIHDIVAVRGRLNRIRQLITGEPEKNGPQ